ncbi:protein of unknown function UPF0054 [Coriobacterium glomerans PW2]|uniref:Endoribonuclease YbeY n=1 Tax=Coriobacterium glomerans (strain ATCC 49209 / DSM 20642 / JCM 10262 / PW2) TaxID=700015 RepID=F2N7Q4_CORGP|nr:protein of unknown function UPF0054 [Coriobacterium glomerans PW2]
MAVTVLISSDEGLEAPIGEDEIMRIAAFVLEREGIEIPVELSVSFVGASEMRDLNRSWRGIDEPTDVLSFECDRPDSKDSLAGRPGCEQPLELGDVILAPEIIAAQATGFKNTAADECRLMLVHGLLHLLGWDHIAEEDAEAMEAREDELLRGLGRQRDARRPIAIAPTTRHPRRTETEGSSCDTGL